MKQLVEKIPVISILIALMICLQAGSAFSEIQKMTRDELRAVLEDPEFVIIDVRSDTDWRKSDQKVKGAVREDPRDVDAWSGKYPKEKAFVLYCS